jgi:hypothetical protein
MTFPRARVTVAAALFLAWLGYLLYLVLASRHTIVLSRPQLLAADLVVLAEVADDDGKPATHVKVLDVFRRPADRKLINQELVVRNLPDAARQGYIGPGKYILPLGPVVQAKHAVADIEQVPPNPGFEAAFVNVRLWAAGKAPERVAELAVDYLGIDARNAKDLVDRLVRGETKTVMLASHVPRSQAEEFRKALLQVDPADFRFDENEHRIRNVDLIAADIRIYPWTPETKEQIEEILR